MCSGGHVRRAGAACWFVSERNQHQGGDPDCRVNDRGENPCSRGAAADGSHQIAQCQKALTYDAKDPWAHYTLGLAFMTKAVKSGSVAELDPALQHFQQMIEINPDMDEAAIARKNIAAIRQYLKQPSATPTK